MNFYEYDITSPFGTRTDPIDKTIKNHNGIDFALPLNTDVKANVSGTVTKSTTQKDGFGNYVVVKDGSGKLHYYAHLNKSLVNSGDIISVGDSLGLSGSTGRSTGPHLHYEVRDSSGTSVNPSSYLTLSADSPQTNGNTQIPSILDSLPSQYQQGFEETWFDGIKDKLKLILFNIFKFIIIALLIVLFVVFITKALDINII